jgi:hypothetical protein
LGSDGVLSCRDHGASPFTAQHRVDFGLIALCVEMFRLVHAPWLDDFRLTLAGALLFGRIFSPWDILAYSVGIVLATVLDGFAVRLKEPVLTPPAEIARSDAVPPRSGA